MSLQELQRFLETGVSAKLIHNEKSYDCRILSFDIRSGILEIVFDVSNAVPEGAADNSVEIMVTGEWYSVKVPAYVEKLSEHTFGYVALLKLKDRIVISKKRRHQRYPTLMKVKATSEDDKQVADCVIVDISANGLGLICEGFKRLPQKFTVFLNEKEIEVLVRSVRKIGWMYKLGTQVEKGRESLEEELNKIRRVLIERGFNL